MCGMTKYEHGHFYKASNTVPPATKALGKLHRSCLKNIFESTQVKLFGNTAEWNDRTR